MKMAVQYFGQSFFAKSVNFIVINIEKNLIKTVLILLNEADFYSHIISVLTRISNILDQGKDISVTLILLNL